MSERFPKERARFRNFFSFGKFQGMLLLLSGAAAFCFFVELVRFLPVTGDNTYPEAQGIVIAHRWAAGEPLYRDFRQPPYLMTSFPPLWYASLAIMPKARASNLDSLTLAGRLLSLTSLVGLCVLAYLWSRRQQIDMGLALLGPLLFLSLPILMPWAVTARPDFPALFLSLLAILLITRNTRMHWVFLAGTSAAAAFLMKHSLVALPVATVVWMAWSRRWRHLVLFCFTWGALVGATLERFNSSSHGMMSLNLSPGNFGSASIANVHQLLVALLTSPGHQFAVVTLALGIFGFSVTCQEKGEGRLICLYFVTATALAVFGSGYSNANENHFFEAALVSTLLAPRGLAKLKRFWDSQSPMPAFSFILLLLLLVPAVDLQRWRMYGEEPPYKKRLVSLVENKEILTDIPYVAARSRSLELLEPTELTKTELVGRWSSAPIQENLRTEKYDLVILHRDLADPRWKTVRYPSLSPALQAAIARNYHFCFELDAAYVYAPLHTGTSDSRAVGCPAFH